MARWLKFGTIETISDAMKCAGEIDAQHALPLVGAHFLDRAFAHDAGVVHEDVDLAEAVADSLDHRAHLRSVSDIGLNDQRVAKPGGNLLGIGFVAAFRGPRS